MSLELTKILTQLSYPLSWSLLLLLLAWLFFLIRRQLIASLLMVMGLGGLWLFSTPIFSDVLLRSLESQHPPLAMADVPQADAIVVLGGGVETTVLPRLEPDMNAAGDRVWYAAELYRAGKAPLVITTGGKMPWLDEQQTSAEAIAWFLGRSGVPQEVILLEGSSRTTWEDALFTAPLLMAQGAKTVLLVTSSWHMPRALWTFQRMGIQVIAAPTDFEVTVIRDTSFLRWMPDARKLEASSRAIKEYLGMITYQFKEIPERARTKENPQGE
jgi:uncharacterized SAM-binding protein YcdF (DUF218 family)